MGTVRIVHGSVQSSRSARIDALAAAHWGRFRLIVPTARYGRDRAIALLQIAQQPGLWGRPVQDFDAFAEELLALEGVHVRRVDRLERRHLMARALATPESRAALDVAKLSASEGLLTQLLGVINELKQAAVEPDTFAERAGNNPMDALVAAVYRGYQDALHEERAYDVPGVYWQAAIVATQRRPRILEGVDALLFDGFDDFTASELRLAERLAPQVKLLVFGLNADVLPGRADQFALSLRTLEEIRARFAAELEHAPEPEPSTTTDFLLRHLFWRDAPPQNNGLIVNTALWPCIERAHEVERIARRIKTLVLNEGVRLDQVAVVFRRTDTVLPLVERIFREFGIPWRAAAPPTLVQSVAAAHVLRLLEALTHWEREAVVEVLSSPLGQGVGLSPAHRAAVRHLARRAGIIAGRQEWDEGLQTLAQRIEKDHGGEMEHFRRRMPNASAHCAALRTAFARLAQLSQMLPSVASAADHARALLTVLNELHADKTVSSLESGAPSGMTELRGLLARFERGRTEETLSAEAFQRMLVQGMQETSCAALGPRAGIAVMTPEQIRNLRFDFVFYGGLNEGAVPAMAPINAIYSEADVLRLRAKGVFIAPALEHHDRERLLFLHVLAAARHGLVLSWVLQKEGGREAAPSPFVAEVMELLGDRPNFAVDMPLADGFVAEVTDLSSTRDLRNCGMHRVPALRDMLSAQFDMIEAGLACEEARACGAPPDVYDGMLSKEACAVISARFSEEHRFSVSQIESWLVCPFQFFAERVLHVSEIEAPEYGFDPQVRGSILHEALQLLMARYAGRPLQDIPLEEAIIAAEAALNQAFERLAWQARSARPGVRRVERARMLRDLRRYVNTLNAETQPWTPMHFEVGFGMGGGEPPTAETPFVLETRAGPLRFSGRIDRMDKLGDTWRILDYKSGGMPAVKDIKLGINVQLAVYALAVEKHLFPGSICAEAAYVGLRKGRSREALKPAKDETREDVLERARASVALAVRCIREGRFAPAPQKRPCHGCGTAHACRYQEARILRKRVYNAVLSTCPDDENEEEGTE